MLLKDTKGLLMMKLSDIELQIKKAIQRICLIAVYSTLSYFTFTPIAYAGPNGGNIVGGSGSINTSGLTTNINQLSSSMAIDWNSYNLNSNETVNYLQPSSSSISLNRILGGASQIHGKINANGQVVLVNPNGIFFGQDASINVGGLIASGLDIDPVDFMNGEYVFSGVVGTDGVVINSGLINASLGGNVALLGRQVKNEGIINAKLGAITLASGKEAILTFDNNGLIGVRISKEILQDEIGVDPAVLNSGEINASGGRVLLTASVSRDVFSEAVNHGDLQQATSVVVHEDGSFTLGGGADVVNSGAINVSGTGSNDAGQVVLLGENITHTGSTKADSESGVAGMIELHAMNKTELKGAAQTSAQSHTSGQGGQIKLLGDKVGLFDTAEVNAGGANGGGEILIGGDRQGLNSNVRNAEFLYLGKDSNIFADAIASGDGGRIITYANDTGRFHGGIYARGGAQGGDGGFIETSGKKGFEIPVAPDVSAVSGQGGLWLIDPYNITIQTNGVPGSYDTTGTTTYTSISAGATIGVGIIETALGSGDVEIITGLPTGGVTTAETGDILFDAILDFDNTGNRTLTLKAEGSIIFKAGSSIEDTDIGTGDSLNINLFANTGIDLVGGSTITTNGGNLTVGGSGGNTPISFTNNGTINTTGWEDTAGGNISIETSGFITTSGLTANGGSATNNMAGADAGFITLTATDAITVNGNGNLSATGSGGNDGGGGGDQWIGGNGGAINISSNASSVNITGQISNSGGDADGDIATVGGNAGDLTISSQAGIGTITLSGDIISSGGMGFGSGDVGNKSDITLDGILILSNSLTLDVNSFTSGNITAGGAADVAGNNINITSVTNITTGSITTNGGATSLDTSGNNGGNIILDALGNISINGAIKSSGSAANTTGTGGSAGLVELQSAGQTNVSDITAVGGIGAGATNGTTADIIITTQSLNFNGIAPQTISGSNITIDSTNEATTLQSLTLKATNNVNITASINTNGSDFNVSGVNYDAQSTVDRKFTINTGVGNADINMTGTVSLGDMVVDGALDIAAGGAVTQGTANTDTDDLVVSGSTSISANGSDITLNNQNDFSDITVIGNDVTLKDISGITLNATTLGGTLDVTANGDIAQSGGALIVTAGATTLNANDNNITLLDIGNNFASVGATGANVELNDVNGIILDASTITGTLDVTAIGAGTITQSGILTVGGVANLDVAGDIILDASSNNFGTVNIVNGKNVTLVDTDEINLQSTNIVGDLTVTAGGDISNSDSLSVTGISSFTTASNSSVYLTNVGNNLNGTLSFADSSGSLMNVEITNTSATNIAAVDALNLTITSGGTITQTSAYTVTNTTTLSAAGQNITLDQDNNLNQITIVGASTALINNGSNDLSLGRLVVDNALSLLTTGAISDGNGVLNNVQADLLEITAANGIGHGDELEIQINKLDAENNSSGEVRLSQIGDIELIALKNLGSNGDITFNSDGDINFNPGSTVAGVTEAGDGDTGNLLMQTSSGNFLGLGAADINNPDITAKSATFFGLAGTFGTFQRPITLKVPGTVVVEVRVVFDPVFKPPGPSLYDPQGIKFSAFSTISAVAGEQLLEIESLSDVDPAIFTALRNYSYEEISIRMPRDQLYEDELDDLALN